MPRAAKDDTPSYYTRQYLEGLKRPQLQRLAKVCELSDHAQPIF